MDSQLSIVFLQIHDYQLFSIDSKLSIAFFSRFHNNQLLFSPTSKDFSMESQLLIVFLQIQDYKQFLYRSQAISCFLSIDSERNPNFLWNPNFQLFCYRSTTINRFSIDSKLSMAFFYRFKTINGLFSHKQRFVYGISTFNFFFSQTTTINSFSIDSKLSISFFYKCITINCCFHQ